VHLHLADFFEVYFSSHTFKPPGYITEKLNHITNSQTIAFCHKMPEIGAAWQGLSEDERAY